MSEIITKDSEKAATKKTIHGWMSSKGRFYSDEQTARYDGCTHAPCSNCGKLTEKMWTHCEDCREKRAIERHSKRKTKKWNGDDGIYSDFADEMFWDIESIDDYMEENNVADYATMRLLLAEPKTFRLLESDYWEEFISYDDDEIPAGLAEAIDVFNEALSKIKPRVWEPGKFAVDVSEWGKPEENQ